jgi:hypothetical protein
VHQWPLCQLTITFIPEPTARPAIPHISGFAFIDMNANGLRDLASFALSLDKSGNLPDAIQIATLSKERYPKKMGSHGKQKLVNRL